MENSLASASASAQSMTSRITAAFYMTLVVALVIIAPISVFATKIRGGLNTVTFSSITAMAGAISSILQFIALYLAQRYPTIRPYINPLSAFGVTACVIIIVGLIFLLTSRVDSCPGGKRPNRSGAAISFVAIVLLAMGMGVAQNMSPVFGEILAPFGAQAQGEPFNLAMWTLFASVIGSVQGWNTLHRCV